MSRPNGVRLVCAEKVRILKHQAVRCRHQNVDRTRFTGQIIEDVLRELDLWEEGEHELSH